MLYCVFSSFFLCRVSRFNGRLIRLMLAKIMKIYSALGGRLIFWSSYRCRYTVAKTYSIKHHPLAVHSSITEIFFYVTIFIYNICMTSYIYILYHIYKHAIIIIHAKYSVYLVLGFVNDAKG